MVAPLARRAIIIIAAVSVPARSLSAETVATKRPAPRALIGHRWFGAVRILRRRLTLSLHGERNAAPLDIHIENADLDLLANFEHITDLAHKTI